MSKPNATLLLEQHARQVRQPIDYTHGAEETPESTPIEGQLSTLSVSKAAIPLMMSWTALHPTCGNHRGLSGKES